MTSKAKYRSLCSAEKTIPLFSRDWWLDAVCGEDWDVVLSEEDGRIVAALPFHIKRRFGLKALTAPKLTPRLGPWVRYPGGLTKPDRLSFEKKVLTALIDQLPKHDVFAQCFHDSITNWLPFYWRKFSQTTRYTYVIDDLSDLSKAYAQIKARQRTKISKARGLFTVAPSDDLETFYGLVTKTFERQDLKPPFRLDYLRSLDAACVAHDARQLLFARDAAGRVHAGMYLVYDEHSVWDLASGINPELGGGEARALLVWEAIRFAAAGPRRFDFSGSMLEGVEQFNRSYGSEQKPYFFVNSFRNSKAKMMFLAAEFLRELIPGGLPI